MLPPHPHVCNTASGMDKGRGAFEVFAALVATRGVGTGREGDANVPYWSLGRIEMVADPIYLFRAWHKSIFDKLPSIFVVIVPVIILVRMQDWGGGGEEGCSELAHTHIYCFSRCWVGAQRMRG